MSDIDVLTGVFLTFADLLGRHRPEVLLSSGFLYGLFSLAGVASGMKRGLDGLTICLLGCAAACIVGGYTLLAIV